MRRQPSTLIGFQRPSGPKGTRSARLRWIAVPVALCAVALAGWNAFTWTALPVGEEQNVRDAVDVVGHSMSAGEDQDPSAGERLVAGWSEDPELSSDGVAELFGTGRAVFDDYAAVDRETYGTGFSTTLFGTRASIGGVVSYDGRAGTPFQAVLVKRNNDWRLTSVTFES